MIFLISIYMAGSSNWIASAERHVTERNQRRGEFFLDILYWGANQRYLFDSPEHFRGSY